jgi:hypothetical protein
MFLLICYAIMYVCVCATASHEHDNRKHRGRIVTETIANIRKVNIPIMRMLTVIISCLKTGMAFAGEGLGQKDSTTLQHRFLSSLHHTT